MPRKPRDLTGGRVERPDVSPLLFNNDDIGSELLASVYEGDLSRMMEAFMKGAGVDYADPATGLTALHIAVGTNNLSLARILVDRYKAPFGPDSKGRWPTSIAARSRVSEKLCDYIVEAESAYLNGLMD